MKSAIMVKPRPAWRDIGHLVAYIAPLTVYLSYQIHPVATISTTLFGFGLIPLLDAIVGVDERNYSHQFMEEIDNNGLYKIIPAFGIFLQVALILWSFQTVTHHSFNEIGLWFMALGIAISNVILGGTGGHELLHRTKWWEKALGGIGYGAFAYGHFCIEHIIGHHFRVATPEDPTTSRLNENVYQFLPRTIWGSLVSVWTFEKKRLARKELSVFSSQNRLWKYFAIPIVFTAIAYVLGGTQAILFYFVLCALSIILAEIVNYIEHYGLERRKLPNGRYEKVSPLHSWNADHVFSNYLIFNLARHSDHHANANRRYQLLRSFPQSPQMPYGYPTMYLIALVPPLWRKVMNPKVFEFRERLKKIEASA